MSLGTAAALQPFLSKLVKQTRGVPWSPMHRGASKFATSYLRACGQLTHLSRMAALEHNALATTAFPQPNHVTIRVPLSGPELALQQAIKARNKRIQPPSPSEDLNELRWQRLHKRMKSYVDSPDGWFIRYANDQEIVSAYYRKAQLYGKRYLEAEALPDDIKIGDRTFGEWKHACDQALGRVLCHIDFVGLLQKKWPKIAAPNVLTLYARRDDVDEVWREAGLAANRVSPTMQALTLESENVGDWEKVNETPCPFYVDLGRDHVLLPCFGALTNPYFTLFRHLRTTYQSDWDQGVDRREEIFRSDLAGAFPEPDFLVPQHGIQLRRVDGSKLTDVDAIIIDRKTGTLALVQLKWHDVFGLSLPERESRRRNISKANEWIERVISWVDGRTSAELCKVFGFNVKASNTPPVLYVVARYAARFTGEKDQDPRASWLGWPEILNVLNDLREGDVLLKIPRLVFDQEAKFYEASEKKFEFRFPELSVDLYIEPERW